MFQMQDSPCTLSVEFERCFSLYRRPKDQEGVDTQSLYFQAIYMEDLHIYSHPFMSHPSGLKSEENTQDSQNGTEDIFAILIHTLVRGQIFSSDCHQNNSVRQTEC